MKRTIYTLLLLFIAFTIDAQQLEVNPPTSGLYGGLNDDEDGVVGTIGGTVDVSALGGATYSIPIQVPASTGNIQPNLSLVYNNQSGNGLLGWGWNLGGISAITRTGQTLYHDNNMSGVTLATNHDRFFLDGQRMISIKDKDGEDGCEYRTEVDGMNKIVSYGQIGYGPDYFKTFTSSGLIINYGHTPDSKILSEGNKTVCFWLMDTVMDRNGNFMVYKYDNYGSNYRLSRIEYGMNLNNESPNDFTNYVDFKYTDRNDEEYLFIGNQMISYPWLLKEINVNSYYEGKTYNLGKYTFSYKENTGENSDYYYSRLDAIYYECGDYHYNPTIIEWGNIPVISNGSSFPNYHEGFVNCISANANERYYKGVQKFAGDFNGDGLSDFISVYTVKGKDRLEQDDDNEKKNTTYAQPFINIGNTKTNSAPGELMFKQVGKALSFHDYDLIWIYVCDFNGDGMDDFFFMSESNRNVLYKEIHVYACKSIVENGVWNYKITDIGDDDHYSYIVGNNQHGHIYVGDFMGRGKSDMIFQPPLLMGIEQSFRYFEYDKGSDKFTFEKSKAEFGFHLPIGRYATMDYDGDGKTEIWGYDGESDIFQYYYDIVKDYDFFNGEYTYMTSSSYFNSKDTRTPFLGDFNGDGILDILWCIGEEDENKSWTIRLGKGNGLGPTYNVSDILNNITGGGAPYYGYSISDRQAARTYFLNVADMNGDGKSDVVCIDMNGNMNILYGPVISGFMKGYGHFARREGPFAASNVGLATNDAGSNIFARCVGNFFGEECLSIMDGIAFDKYPLSEYYNVNSITDGMGNKVDYNYGYLVHNPQASDNMFKLTNSCEDLDVDVISAALPIKAAKQITTYNVLEDKMRNCSSYKYENAIIHRLGRGLLGVANKSQTDWFENGGSTCGLITLSNQEFSLEDMKSQRALVLKSESVSTKRNEASTPILLSNSTYTYYRFIAKNCNEKIFVPLVKLQKTYNYDIETGDFLSININENQYYCDCNIHINPQTNNKHFYDYIIKLEKTIRGVGTNPGLTSAEDCKYTSTSEIIYTEETDEDVNEWIVNRIYRQKETISCENNDDIKTETRYKYLDSEHPYLPTIVLNFPDAIGVSRLCSRTFYEYDRFGNVKKKELEAQYDFELENRIMEYEYSDDGRFIIKRTNPLLHVSQSAPNYAYGFIKAEIDCNGLVTEYRHENPFGGIDLLGITQKTIFPDNTQSATATRWVVDEDGNREIDAPSEALYYIWVKSSGNGEIKTYYDVFGKELRIVTIGLNNTKIYLDKEYDAFGRLEIEYDPYYSGNQRNKYVKYEYDIYHRLLKTTYQDGTYTMLEYDNNPDKLATISEFHPNVGNLQTAKKTSNAIGWLMKNEESKDSEGHFITVDYDYYADGLLKWTMVDGDENTKISMQYDVAGNRKELFDPDYGTVSSEYDAFGQLKTTSKIKGNVTNTAEYEYDKLGRMITRIENDGENGTSEETNWAYDFEMIGNLSYVWCDRDDQDIHYEYDQLNRLERVTEYRHSYGSDLITEYQYDMFSRIKKETYPTGFIVNNQYDDNGFLYLICDRYGNELWKTLETNEFGQIKKFEMGNGVETTYDYYDDTHYLKTIVSTNNIQDLYYHYDNFGNLDARKDNIHDMEETFLYDHLNRLEHITCNGMTSTMKYDDFGRISSKMSNGEIVFNDAKYETVVNGEMKPHAISSAVMYDNPFPSDRMDIEYTMFDKVKTISQEDMILTYEYGIDHQRIGVTEAVDGHLTMSKVYVNNCEFVSQGSTIPYTYLSGPMGVFAVVRRIRNFDQIHYVYKDHLGSWTTITDSEGYIEQELSFDAWGNLRDAAQWNSDFNGTPLFDRGFTGHEHLWDFGLINMNGRMYDPIMSSFLSVDNYVQSPENSQNFNRYAYCLNNPLKYTDPDGEWVQYVVGGLLGAINGYSIGKAAGLTDWNLAWSTIGGAAVGAISGGVGTYMTSVSTAAIGGLCGGAISGAGNGLIQGLATNSETLGADVWNGLWKGGVSGLVGGYVGGGCGLYGGKGAFLGGMAGSLTNELCNFATIDGYKINGWNVLAGGAMSFGVYHAQVGAGYLFGGFKGKLSYNDFCKMMSVSQKSMREWKEGRFIAYSDDTKAFSCMGDEYSVGIDSEHLTNAKLDYHTHAEWPENLADYDLMSTSKSAQLEGLQPNQCDEASRVMLTKIGCEHMYQGSRNGSIVYMTNKILPQTKVSICLYQQIRVPYNYSSIFHYYQHQYVFKLKH